MRKHKVKFRTSSKRIPLCVQYVLEQCAGADCKVIGITFITVFVMRRDAACSSLRVVTVSPLWPPVNRNILWSFRHTSIGQLFMLDQGGGQKASPKTGFRDTCW